MNIFPRISLYGFSVWPTLGLDLPAILALFVLKLSEFVIREPDFAVLTQSCVTRSATFTGVAWRCLQWLCLRRRTIRARESQNVWNQTGVPVWKSNPDSFRIDPSLRHCVSYSFKRNAMTDSLEQERERLRLRVEELNGVKFINHK